MAFGGSLPQINLGVQDKSDVEIAVLPPDASELTDKDEGNKNEVNISEITVRCPWVHGENRINHGCPAEESKSMRKEERGTPDSALDENSEIFHVRWNDNRTITVATNFSTLEPFFDAKRREGTKKQPYRLDSKDNVEVGHPQTGALQCILVFKNARRKSSDEAHFWLNGYVNKQNCRIWSKANPQEYIETPLHPEKLTVWCALWAGGILLQKR
ncbi:putative transposable element [Trichonephila clavipes]|nr:putative transposable element [Trichonephila clavipes]